MYGVCCNSIFNVIVILFFDCCGSFFVVVKCNRVSVMLCGIVLLFFFFCLWLFIWGFLFFLFLSFLVYISFFVVGFYVVSLKNIVSNLIENRRGVIINSVEFFFFEFCVDWRMVFFVIFMNIMWFIFVVISLDEIWFCRCLKILYCECCYFVRCLLVNFVLFFCIYFNYEGRVW